jgi:addiction module HigA family antidote
MTQKRPIKPLHPGDVLGEELLELNITGAELARAIGVPANRIYQLIAGRRSMTADTAQRLQQWNGVSAEFWLNLQKMYELDVVRRDSAEDIARAVKPLVRSAA